MPKDWSKHKSLVTAKKSEPVSKRTLAGVSSDPKYIVPTYPAPSSFFKSTLKPVPDQEGLAGARAALAF